MQKSRRARLDEASRGGHSVGERGFTVLEALVALTLLTITLLGISSLFLTGMGAAGIAQDSSVAANLARERLDTILQAPGSLPGLDGTSTTTRVPVGSGPTFTALTCVDTSNSSFTDVRVRVSWGEAIEGSRPRYSRQFETQVAAANSGGRASTCP